MTSVTTAKKALDAYEYERPDIIISDIGLPEEDGYHFMESIRSLERERNLSAIPAVAVTAFAGPQDRRNARDAGFNQHLAKPVDPAMLIAAIGALVGEHRKPLAGD